MRKILTFFVVAFCYVELSSAINYSGGDIYFCDALGVDKGSMMLCARKSDYTFVAELSPIAHTKLYYKRNPDGYTDGNILGWVVMSATTKWDSNNFDNWTAADWCSNWNTYGFNSGSTYLIVPSSTEKSQAVTTSYMEHGISDFNHAQTVYKYTSTDNGANYSAQELNSGTVTISAYKLHTEGGASDEGNSKTIDDAAELSAEVDAAYSGEVTLTAAAAGGYEFVGWYDSENKELSKVSPYTYNAPNEEKSVYARFKATGATALDNTAVEVKAIKLMENGQLVIIKNGVKYNALGAEVK